VNASKKSKMKKMLPDEDLISNTIRVTLTRFGRSAREVAKKRRTTEKGKLIQSIITIVSMANDTSKVIVVEEIDFAVEEIGAKQRREGNMNCTLSPGRKVRIPTTKKISRSVGVKRRNIDAVHTAILDDIRVIGKEMLASSGSRETGKAVTKWLEHPRVKDNTLKVAEKVGAIKLWELHRYSMISDPTKLRTRSNPRDD
jgi:hypothetical protein